MKIIADANIPYIKDYFGKQGDLHLLPGREISAADVAEADILLVRSVTSVNEALLADSQLKFVGSVTSGMDHIDTAYLDQHNILWAHAPGFNAQAVADYVVSVVAAVQKKQLLLAEKKRAMVSGVGQVGRLVATHLQALGFEVLQSDPLRAKKEKDFKSIDIEAIEDVDLVSIHTPLTFAEDYPTYHMINAEFLRRQKRDTVIVNAARGAVIDTEALIEHGAHLHACLDVFEHEPKVSRTLLEYVLLATPHIAGYSVQSKMRGIQMIYQAALDKKIINGASEKVPAMLEQTLDFAGKSYQWQDVVLGVFNPFLMTAMMRANLMAVDETQIAFDEMRKQFNFRHEFAYTSVGDIQLSSKDQEIIKQLGFKSDFGHCKNPPS